jgi:hypothetical protein
VCEDAAEARAEVAEEEVAVLHEQVAELQHTLAVAERDFIYQHSHAQRVF